MQNNLSLPAPSNGQTAYPAFATVDRWCDISGLGRTVTFEALGRGDLRAKKAGARTLIDVQHGLAYLKNLPDASIRPHGYRSKPAT